MGLGAGVLAAAVLAVGTPPGQGANITAYTRDAYGGDAAAKALRQLRDIGVRQVAIVPTWYMDDAGDSTVERDPRRTPSDSSLSTLIRRAREQGMSVLLKPHVDVADGTFRGDISPVDEATWWTTYRDMMERYATLAETTGAETLTVGVELRSMSDEQATWEGLIADVRDRYTGALTYAANWDEVEQVRFWRALDAIGVDAYYPLAREPGASVDQLVAAWGPIIERLERISDANQRPLILTEIGYAARPQAAVNPSGAGATPGPVDVDAQATAYEAVLKAWSETELDSLYWWDWPADPRDAVGDAFTPRDRPAARVIERFTDTGEDVGLLSRIPWPLLVIITIWTLVALGFLAILRAAGQADPPRGGRPVGRRGRALPGLAQLDLARLRVRPPRRLRPPLTPAVPQPVPELQPARGPAPDVEAGPTPGRPPEQDVVDRDEPTGRPAPRAHISTRPGGLVAEIGAVDLDRLAALACEVLAADMCAVLVRAPDDPQSLITAGESGVSLRGRRWRADAGVAGLVLTRAAPVAVIDYAALDARLGGDQTRDVRTAAAAPLMVHRALRGALSVGSADSERRFEVGDLELLGVLAELAAAALARPGGPDLEGSVRSQLAGLTAAMEAREPDERRRTTALSAITGRVADRLLPDDPRGRAELMLAARLHDVGMLRVPSAPLRKPGPLAGRDRRLIDEHPAWGCDLLAEIPGMQGVAAIVRFHHERWDGSGYPHALSGQRIPLASRILAATEAWTAMTIGRPHAPARSPEHAVVELRQQAGQHFDPEVVEVLATVSATVPRPLAGT